VRILLLTHSFNSLAQRLYVELTRCGHELSVELDINDAVSEEAVALFRPELILAPFLKRAIPESIWRRHTCIIVHPGIRGDRGPSALDWAILEDEAHWGVTCLQANGEMDAGDIWASVEFPMRAARKSSLYRNEVTEAAVQAVLLTVERFRSGGFCPQPLDYRRADVRGRPRPPMRQSHRAVDWARDDTATVLRKVRAADSFPGVLDALCGGRYYLYDAHEEDELRGAPGETLATRDEAICRATRDGAVWITHLREHREEPALKLPSTLALGDRLCAVPEVPVALDAPAERRTWREIRYEHANGVGYLHFDCYNGAMGTEQCRRMQAAYEFAKAQDTGVIVLMGGSDFWSNGMHLNLIEAAESPAEESWRNINAMDDLTESIIRTERQLTIAALRGNAGAGGVFLALAADRVYARSGVVLNPHYKNMGNLYGSEYWTYLLPRRVGAERGREIMQHRLPLGTVEALSLGLIDGYRGASVPAFERWVRCQAEGLAADAELPGLLDRKRAERQRDEATKPLAAYREEELQRMKLNFYGFDPSYHVARYNFVHRVPHAWTPLHLAWHRRRAAPHTSS
jgi:putative two-component system protein, hydrogenase maturation factor HypX/HoxX